MARMKQQVRIAVLAAGMAVAAACHASPVNYALTLTVSSFLMDTDLFPSTTDCQAVLDLHPSVHSFGCGWQAGDQIVGTFQVADDTAGLADGVYRGLSLSSFAIELGSVNFDMSLPGPASDFDTFTQGYVPGLCAAGADAGSPAGNGPAMIVSGGAVSDFCGAARGPGGVPWLKFNDGGTAGHRFDAYTYNGAASLGGTFTISRIPTPGTLPLAAAALFLLLWPHLRRRRIGGHPVRESAPSPRRSSMDRTGAS